MLTSATEADFTAFLTTYGYTVASNAVPLLARSFVYLQTLPWCSSDQDDHASINLAQCFIAYAMSAEGGAFNPTARVDGLVVKRKKVDVLEQEFMFNDNIDNGTSSISLLKSYPIAYGLLLPFLCETPQLSADSHRASVYVV